MESEWGSVEEFVSDLEGVMDTEESEIKETELSTPGRYTTVIVRSGNKGRVKSETMDVMVDKLNRVYLPPRFANREVKSVEIGGVRHDIQKADERYEGDDVVSVVCYLEGGTREAGTVN